MPYASPDLASAGFPGTRRSPRLGLLRTPLRQLSAGRILRGGRLGDAGRLPRYAGFFLAGLLTIWAPITAYLVKAPLRYTSSSSLILPGSGTQASVNLEQIGQASSTAPSAFSSASVSPTETYKRLLAADRILAAAGARMNLSRKDFGMPKIELVDQTGLIRLDMVGNSAEDAQARGQALLDAFFAELDALRQDEKTQRTESEDTAIADYRAAVATTRASVARLQHETGLVSAQQYAGLVAENDRLAGRVAELAVRYAQTARSVRALESTLGLGADLAAATLKLQADAEYMALVSAMADSAAEVTGLRAIYGPEHPLRRTAEERAATARARMAAHAAALTGLAPDALAQIDISRADERAGLLRDLVTAAAEEQGVAAELKALQDQSRQLHNRVIGLMDAAARLEDSERDFRVAETVLASTMARSKTAKADLYASYPLVQVLEDPSLPPSPSSPKRVLAGVAGGAASIFLFIGLALGWVRQRLINGLLAAPEGRAA